MNKRYSAEIEQFIRDEFYMPTFNCTDENLTSLINLKFGTNYNKAAVRKKRQRMGLAKASQNSPKPIEVSPEEFPQLEIQAEANLRFLEEVIFGKSKDLENSP